MELKTPELPCNVYLENIKILLASGTNLRASGFLKRDKEVIHLAVGKEEKDEKGGVFSRVDTVIEIPFHSLVSIIFRRNREKRPMIIKANQLLKNLN